LFGAYFNEGIFQDDEVASKAIRLSASYKRIALLVNVNHVKMKNKMNIHLNVKDISPKTGCRWDILRQKKCVFRNTHTLLLRASFMQFSRRTGVMTHWYNVDPTVLDIDYRYMKQIKPPPRAHTQTEISKYMK